MNETYELTTIGDLLKIPANRRAACFRDLEYVLALHDLVAGTGAEPDFEYPLRWTDDDDHSVTMGDSSGNELQLVVTNEPD